MGGLSIWHILIVLIVFPALVAMAFLPSIIAFARRHQNRAAILVLNIFLGWTFVGWVIALVWAFTAVRPDIGPAKTT